MAKKLVGTDEVAKLKRGSSETHPPPVAPALASAGINIMEFCKAFNARSGH